MRGDDFCSHAPLLTESPMMSTFFLVVESGKGAPVLQVVFVPGLASDGMRQLQG